MKSWTGYPLARPTSASPTAVFPDEESTITFPARSAPDFSPSVTSDSAVRSFTERRAAERVEDRFEDAHRRGGPGHAAGTGGRGSKWHDHSRSVTSRMVGS